MDDNQNIISDMEKEDYNTKIDRVHTFINKKKIQNQILKKLVEKINDTAAGQNDDSHIDQSIQE